MRRSWTVEQEQDIPAGASRAIQDSIQGSFPPAALLLTLAGYAILFGFLAVLFGFLAVRCLRWE